MAIEEIKCFCIRTPLLALIKHRNGKPYVHIRCYKGNRIYVEVELTVGTMRFKCRECFRWHEVSIVRDKASVRQVNDGA